MDSSTPGFPVLHYLPEFAQTDIHCISDANQVSHLLSSPFPPALNISQTQGLFCESAVRIRWPKFWSFSFTINSSIEYSGLISFRFDWFELLAIQKTLRSLLQHHNYMSAQRKTKYCTENLAKITQKGKIKCYFLFLLWIFLYFQKFLCLPN